MAMFTGVLTRVREHIIKIKNINNNKNINKNKRVKRSDETDGYEIKSTFFFFFFFSSSSNTQGTTP